VITSQAITASASNTSAVAKLCTWRLHRPAPRSSTGTPAAGPWRTGSRRWARAPQRAKRPPPSLTSVAVDPSGR
jgi:hypothetical protein